MIKIITYLCLALFIMVFLSISHHLIDMPSWYVENILLIKCTLVGIMGGILYCLRAVYLNKCVRKEWDKDWEVWYYLRPIASGISGFISYIFLKAGLLVLEADAKPDAIAFGYLAIAFIAGYNVDNFMKKLESIASSVWGIKKSRASDDINTD
ncbi:MAG: hypothetical protein H8D56_18650 [Planctomycetes bacterium]|nr:hypothetical protein [Planctomycetota bacterium]MBL7145895.1 hypothetical protein [Phycisphaerae bacterium]